MAGDWNADGISTIGVRRAQWFYLRDTNDSGGISTAIEWGLPTTVEPRLPGANSTFYTNTAAHPARCLGPVFPDAVPYPNALGVYPDPCFFPGSANGYSRLTAVTMAHSIGFDRIVYRFADDFPLYRVFMRPPESGHSQNGEFVVAGDAALRLVFFDGGEWMEPPPYLPKTITGSTRSMTEAKNIGDFEAVNIWLVGMDRARAFRVIELTNPTRIVVDVQTA